MATPTYALHRIRRNVRRKTAAPPDPPTRAFDERRAAYRTILEEIRVLGGDLAIDELTDWVVARITDTGRLPDPPAVRARAREICADRDVIIPEDSPLRDEQHTQ